VVLNNFWRLHAADAAYSGQAARCSPVRIVEEENAMQVTEEMRGDSEETYRLKDEVLLRLADAGLESSRLRIAEVFHGGPDIPGKWS
jgi:hypothetical protein